jgi:hypothetical protein
MVQYAASVTNGRGQGTAEENSAKSFSGRLTVQPARDVRVSGNVGIHDFPNATSGTDDYATAFGADVEIGNFTRGLHVQAGGTAGENWLNLDVGGDASRFVALQGIITYRVPIADNRFVEGVEPVGRVSWGDPDTGAADDAHLLLTPGLMVHFVSRARIAANVDILVPQTGDTEWALRVQTNLFF